MRGALASALGSALLVAGCGADPSRIDLLLVTIDTLRADRLGCYAGPPAMGPAICGIGEAGVRYEWAFSTAPSTAPSVASILTSLTPAQHQVNQQVRNYMADDVVSVAEVLQQAGWQTAAFVSNPVLSRSKRLDQGFDHYDAQMTRRERNRRSYAERDARQTTDAALDWAHEARRPWFLWVHYQDPHGPYDPPLAGPGADRPGGRPLRVLHNHSGHGGIPAYQALPGVVAFETYERRYLGEIRFVDRQLARLLDGLEFLGDPPAVVLTADHGEALGEDGFFFAHGHSVGFDQIRVPLLLRPPRRAGEKPRPAAVVHQPVSLVDVAPTLLALAGIEAPADFGGRPLPLARAPAVPPAGDDERVLFAEASRQLAAIRGRDYYARERRPGALRSSEGRAWGDASPALPARTARLPDAGPAPDYEPVGAGRPPLEESIRSYLAARPEREPLLRESVDAGLREQLGALGYVE